MLPYPALIGCLIYALKTRSEVCYAVSDLAQYMSKWGERHFYAAMSTLVYLYKTKSLVHKFSRRGSSFPYSLVAFADANHRDDRDAGLDSKWCSQGGYLVYFNGSLVSWRSKRHRCIALSSMEAEYIEATAAAQEIVWWRRLLSELGMLGEGPTVLFEDNQACIATSVHSTIHERSKHIDLRKHWLRAGVRDKVLKLVPLSTDSMIADVMTKHLRRPKLEKFRTQMLEGIDVASLLVQSGYKYVSMLANKVKQKLKFKSFYLGCIE